MPELWSSLDVYCSISSFPAFSRHFQPWRRDQVWSQAQVNAIENPTGRLVSTAIILAALLPSSHLHQYRCGPMPVLDNSYQQCLGLQRLTLAMDWSCFAGCQNILLLQ